MGINYDTMLANLFRGSRYADRLIKREPALRDWLAGVCHTYATVTVATLLENVAESTEATLAYALRRAREQVMLAILCRDLNGLADFNEVASAISQFADGAVALACRVHQAALAAKYGLADDDTNAQLMIVGMGKLGGHELNVSSDIDLIFVYPIDGTAVEHHHANQTSQTKSWHEFHAELGRLVIRSLDNIDENGFVFRVDMRLRPYGTSGPLVTSLAGLSEYFIKQARPWERYAWLKARAITGVSDNRNALEALVLPFVYRRYHDYAAIDEMRSLHAQIRAEAIKRGKEDDIKVGRGGIREIEFIAQLHQLIRGGRELTLQTKSTREALTQLARHRILPAEVVEALQSAYLFLRNLEHRLQYLNDEQTQMLPANSDDRQRIAEAMHAPDWATFLVALNEHRELVTDTFEAAFGATNSTKIETGKENSKTLLLAGVPSYNILETLVDRALSISDDHESQSIIAARLAAWEASSRMATLPSKTRARIQVLITDTIAIAANFQNNDAKQHTLAHESKHQSPHATLFRLWDLIEAIDKRDTYLALLIEYPNALLRIARIMHQSAWAAEFLRLHPILLDEFIHETTIAPTLNWEDEKRQLQQACDAANDDTERQYEILRHSKQIITLKLNIADIEGRMSVMTLSDELSALADMLLDVTLSLAWRSLNPNENVVNTWQPLPGFAIIGYGKLGSKELGYASDLDLVFLYDDTGASSANPPNFAKLAQRLSSWLNTMTRGGILYETDLRLRPDGAAGLLVSSLTAFSEYQTNRAWVWEHQALTRARFCAGDTNLISPFETIRNTVLAQKRDPTKLKLDINTMRDKMRADKKDKPDALNLKHTRGGIVDVEFIVQYLILAYANEHPDFLKNLGNYALLTRAAALGILDEDLAAEVGKAYLAYRERQHRARTNNELETWIGVDELVAERRAVVAVWGALLG